MPYRAPMNARRFIKQVLLSALAVFSDASVTNARSTPARIEHHLSVEVCSRHPELFRVRRMHPDEGTRLIRPTGQHMTIIAFDSGYVVSGDCTSFIRTMGNGIILTNNTRFGIKDNRVSPLPPADPSTGPQPSHFVPPENVIEIAANKFAEGTGRKLVKSWGDLTLWAGPSGSVLGIIRCTTNQRECALDHMLLSSSRRIRDFGFVPAPHAEMHFGNLWMQIALPHGEEASVNYTMRWWQTL